jgi:hypothetical protein
MVLKSAITVKSLSGIRDLEMSLARKEKNAVLSQLPPGHPLLQAAEQEESRGGDLADLPEGHPLKVALQEAKARLMAAQEAEANGSVKKAKDVAILKKAKRLKESKEFRERIAQEELDRARRRDGFKTINEKIDNVLRSMDELVSISNPDDDIFGDDQLSRVKVVRLQRLLSAMRKGLCDSRLRVVGA